MTGQFITFDGRRIGVDEISHEHLSNWIWYANVTMKGYFSKLELDNLNLILDERFEGVLLDYRPKKGYSFEIATLKKKGMLRKNGDIVLPNTIFYHKIRSWK
jgi:hypothetical protein